MSVVKKETGHTFPLSKRHEWSHFENSIFDFLRLK